MSGICLLARLDGSPVPAGHLDAMLAAAPYRGKDGVGRWFGSGRVDQSRQPEGQELLRAGGQTTGNIALGYQALHVTPESTRERQPLVDERRGLVLAAVVRLDDREALRAELRDQLKPVEGGSPDPRDAPTDADLVLAAYARWGEDCGAHLIGDFAFALLDRRAGRAVLQRDPMGMRPLYWSLEPRRLLAASEVSQILAVPGFERKLFEPALAAHLLGEFDSPDWTAYEGVKLLPAGHSVTVPLTTPGADAQPRRFWDIDPHHQIREKSEAAYAERLRELLKTSVASRMRSVKPVAMHLSGGMDSGVVASVAGLLLRDGIVSPPGVSTYSWAFTDLVEADERAVSDLIVEHYGLRSSPVVADELWPLRDYPAHAPDVDDPFAGVYQVLLDHAAGQAAAEGMGVQLVGNRGDLMLGDLARDVPGALLAGQWQAVRDDFRLYRRWKKVGLAKTVWYLLVKPPLETALGLPAVKRLREQLGLQTSRQPGPSKPHDPWINDELVERTRVARAGVRGPVPPEGLVHVARRARYQLIFLPLQMRTLLWAERLHARQGLSLADPWSDRRIAEFVLAVPQWVLQRLSQPKRLARLAMQGVMPEEARARVGKISPAPLYRRGLETRARGTIQTLLHDSESAARGLVHETKLLDHYREVAAGTEETPGLWWALTLEMWLRVHHAGYARSKDDLELAM